MRRQTLLNWRKHLIFTTLATVSLFLASSVSIAQTKKYKPGDRVECDPTQTGNAYDKGTVVPFFKTDYPEASQYYYRVRFDRYPDDPGSICALKFIRPLNEAAPEQTDEAAPKQNQNRADTQTNQKNTEKPKAQAKTDENGTVLADRELLECPVPQKPAAKGARPQPDLLKKVIRCLWEAPAKKGLDGAVTVDIDSFQLGAARKWRPLDDYGNGNPNTTVYPVEVTYTLKTFYRREIEILQNIRVFDCYVNSFSKWECGVGRRIKDGEIKRVPNQ